MRDARGGLIPASLSGTVHGPNHGSGSMGLDRSTMANLRIIDRRQNPSWQESRQSPALHGPCARAVAQGHKGKHPPAQHLRHDSGETVVIPADGTHEPVFRHDPETGERSRVLPGNKEFRAGDRLPRPQGRLGRRRSRGQRGRRGRGRIRLHAQPGRVLDLLFEDLKLPDMVKKQLKSEDSERPHRAGFTTSGPANRGSTSCARCAARWCAAPRSPGPNMTPSRRWSASWRGWKAARLRRRTALRRGSRIAELREERSRAPAKRSRVPFIDPIDLRYNRMEHRPQPIAQAVMFCLMDVSASMDEEMKGLAKRFFLLLHLFLERHYDNVEVVFIRHTQHAEEVDEQTFFEGRQTGGTVVSTALKEMLRIAQGALSRWRLQHLRRAGVRRRQRAQRHRDLRESAQRPHSADHAVYGLCRDQSADARAGRRAGESDLWHGYAQIAEAQPNLAMRRINEAATSFRCSATCSRAKGSARERYRRISSRDEAAVQRRRLGFRHARADLRRDRAAWPWRSLASTFIRPGWRSSRPSRCWTPMPRPACR